MNVAAGHQPGITVKGQVLPKDQVTAHQYRTRPLNGFQVVGQGKVTGKFMNAILEFPGGFFGGARQANLNSLRL